MDRGNEWTKVMNESFVFTNTSRLHLKLESNRQDGIVLRKNTHGKNVKGIVKIWVGYAIFGRARA